MPTPTAPWDWAADSDLAQLWNDVRSHPAANWIGLATPRFLLRQPFGKRTDSIDSFAFRELPVRPGKEHFLWANPGLRVRVSAGTAAATDRRRWPLHGALEVPDLPMPVYDDGGGQAVQPPVEIVLSERARVSRAAERPDRFRGRRERRLHRGARDCVHRKRLAQAVAAHPAYVAACISVSSFPKPNRLGVGA